VKRCGSWKAKKKEYELTLRNLKQTLEQNGLTPDLYHGALLALHREINEIQQKIEPLSKVLESYNDLPPDLTLAQIRIEEMRNRLFQLQEELNQSVTDLI